MNDDKVSLYNTELDRLKNTEKPIVIYGALVSDEAIARACEVMGITVCCICDDSLRKANSVWCGLPVYTFSQILEKYGTVCFILNISYISRVVKKIESAGCEWVSCRSVVYSDVFCSLEGLKEGEYYKSEAERACYCHDSYFEPNKLYVANIDVVVTERCSLRCKECSNLMQFYENPKDYEVDDVIKNTQKLLDITDGVYELRFIGGEPFMNRNLHKIMEPFLYDDRIKRLLIYTNATILPSEEQWGILDNPKVIFMMINYGPDKSMNFDKLIKLLSHKKAVYHVLRMDYWNPCDTFVWHERTEVEQERIFTDCCVKNYVTLIGSGLYRCPYAAHAMNLKAVPHNSEDYFDLDGDIDPAEKKKLLKEYLFDIKKLTTCNYCTSRAFDAKIIPVAEQCSEPRKYLKYV